MTMINAKLRLLRLASMALLALGVDSGVTRAQPPDPAGGSGRLGEAPTPSDPQQRALAEHLKRSGILFYGAWWCPACFRQKSLFGREAGNQLPYVECDRGGAVNDRCQAADIRVYPTWVKGNERLEGVQSLDSLKTWSGFGG